MWSYVDHISHYMNDCTCYFQNMKYWSSKGSYPKIRSQEDCTQWMVTSVVRESYLFDCIFYRKYEEAVTERDHDRDEYRRQQRRGGRRTRFSYPRELQKLPNFAQWILEEVRREQQLGHVVDPRVIDTARGPLAVAAAYKSMYAFGNHYRVLSSELPFKTRDSGVAATFRQVCRNGTRDRNQVNADVEYVGHIEEILELNYRRHCLVVLACDFVKANYVGENATIKKDKWGFT
jgi:hypothetical protein